LKPRLCHTKSSQVDGGDEEDETLKIDLATNELALYLWENYIECNDSTKVIFMGVGEAFKAILHILNTRNCKSSFPGMTSKLTYPFPLQTKPSNKSPASSAS